jgi:hypothetical protein
LRVRRRVPTLWPVSSPRMTNGVLVAPPLRRRRLAAYAEYAGQDLTEELAALGRRLAGLRVLHLSSSDATTDPVSADLPAVVALERELGLESSWLVPRSDADMRGATRANHWWPQPSQSEWSSWLSSNFRAARDISGTWDVAVVHGPALAGVAGIGEEKAGVWLWQPPCSAPDPGGHRAADYLARFPGWLNGRTASARPSIRWLRSTCASRRRSLDASVRCSTSTPTGRSCVTSRASRHGRISKRSSPHTGRRSPS